MSIEKRIRNILGIEKVVVKDQKALALEREIEECLVYFETKDKELHGRLDASETRQARLVSIHGRKFTVGRNGEDYFWQEIGGARLIIGQEPISKQQAVEIVGEIHTVTLPYKAYHQKQQRKALNKT